MSTRSVVFHTDIRRMFSHSSPISKIFKYSTPNFTFLTQMIVYIYIITQSKHINMLTPKTPISENRSFSFTSAHLFGSPSPSFSAYSAHLFGSPISNTPLRRMSSPSILNSQSWKSARLFGDSFDSAKLFGVHVPIRRESMLSSKSFTSGGGNSWNSNNSHELYMENPLTEMRSRQLHPRNLDAQFCESISKQADI
jgi:hypothetical protein